MRQCLTRMVWLGVCCVLGAAGCSREVSPPLVAVSPAGDYDSGLSDVLPTSALPETAEPQRLERDPASSAAGDAAKGEPVPGTALPASSEEPALAADKPDAQESAERRAAVVCGKIESAAGGESRPDAERFPRGALLMAGGGLRYDNAEVWSRFVRLAADYARESGEPEGTPPRIAVFPTAALYPQQTGDRIAAALRSYGADPFVVPIAVKNCGIDVREAVRDPGIVAQIKAAHGAFFSGGQQARITEALRTAEGSDTPALEAIWHLYRAGGVVGGSSAGTAVMSRIMCRAVESQLAVLEKGVTPGEETTAGLGFLDPNWFVDQHFIIRARFARALAVTQHHGLRHGLGVDENTALLVRHGETEIIGYRGAIFLDLSEASHDPTAEGFNVKNARLSYLDRGDRLNMETLVLTPSHEKQAEPVIDPNSPSFEPDHDEPIFTTDILGNSTLLDVMRRLVNNRKAQATGLAFDASAAGRGPVPAFEFRLYRDHDTRAWPPGAGEDFTIANVHLDVRRVEIQRLLYK